MTADGSTAAFSDWAEMPTCPVKFGQEHLDRLLEYAIEKDASDVHVQELKPIWMHSHGRMQEITPRPMQSDELHALVNALCGAHAAGEIAGGKDVDASYTIRPRRGVFYRFRINATGCLVNTYPAIHITIRIIPTIPRPLADLQLPEALESALLRTSPGMFLITGPTGSGKTTLMASALATIAQDPARHEVILTYESPIEYLFDGVPKAKTVVAQAEIGRNIPNWAAGVRNALRRAPTIILVGESRDAETMSVALEAALTGHILYTTLHTIGVAETLGRIARMFTAEERSQIQADLLDSLRMVLTQRLFPSTDGKRTAIREYLVIDEDIRDQLRDVEPLALARTTRRLLLERKMSLIDDARRALAEGRIDQSTFAELEQQYARISQRPS